MAENSYNSSIRISGDAEQIRTAGEILQHAIASAYEGNGYIFSDAVAQIVPREGEILVPNSVRAQQRHRAHMGLTIDQGPNDHLVLEMRLQGKGDQYFYLQHIQENTGAGLGLVGIKYEHP